MLDSILSYVIKSDYVRSWILAYIRHIVTAIGVGLVAKGLASQNMVSDAAGLAVSVAGFYLAGADVKSVDLKITTASVMPSPTPEILAVDPDKAAALDRLKKSLGEE